MDIRPMLKVLSIVDKQAQVHRFEPNWAQQVFIEEFHRQWNAGRPVRIITLKARQIGISTVTEALMFSLAFTLDRLRGLVVAHENDASQGLLEMTQNYWDTYPFNLLYTLKYNSRNELAWRETKSSIKVSTAKNVNAGRSKTLQALHASEVAFWDKPAELMLGLRQAIPSGHGTFISLESTANGMGNWFHQTWEAAEEGDVEYVPLFFPWWKHPEYTAERSSLPIVKGRLDEDERILRNVMIADGRMDYQSRITWRRWAIRNLAENRLEKFQQEYPSVPEEAFIATGTNVFPIVKLKVCYQPKVGVRGRLIEGHRGMEFQPDATGPLTIYSYPSDNLEWGQYLIGGDPTRTIRGDFACAQIINRRTWEQVGMWRAKIDPGHFAIEMARLGTYYNKAILAPEVTGPGQATISALQTLNYPYIWRNQWAEKIPGSFKEAYGFESTAKTKHWAIGFLLRLVMDADVVIHDRTTFHEMRNYVTLPDGMSYGNAEGEGRGHDDTVTALAIACLCSQTEAPIAPFGTDPAENPWDSIEEAWEQMMATEDDGALSAG